MVLRGETSGGGPEDDAAGVTDGRLAVGGGVGEAAVRVGGTSGGGPRAGVVTMAGGVLRAGGMLGGA